MAKYMFSESAGLLCIVVGNSYHVLNGAWTGKRKGDCFVVPSCSGESAQVTTIKDWVEVYPQYWSLEWQKAWYFNR